MRGPQKQPWRLASALLAAAALLACGGRAHAADDPADDAGPVIAAVRKAVADGRLDQTQMLGFNLGKDTFNESPSEPGVLIGFDLGVGKFFDIENIYALRAVFLTAHGEEILKDHGLFRDKPGPKGKPTKTKVLHTVHLRARPGYAVGGVTLRSGLNINGLSLTYMRMKGKALDQLLSYESEWVGDRTGGGEAYMGANGAPVVGIFGCQDDEKICALGLYVVSNPPPAPAAVPPAVPPQPPVQPPAAPPPVIPPRVERPAPPPEPARFDPPAAPPVAPPAVAPEPASAPAAQATTPAAPPSTSSETLLAYIVGAAGFLLVIGLVSLAALNAISRKSPPP
jgi:hypothetical protein